MVVTVLPQTKGFCIAKEAKNRIKRKLTKWEKVCSKYSWDKGLIYGQMSNSKTSISKKQWLNLI
jgi:hypothetical protein